VKLSECGQLQLIKRSFIYLDKKSLVQLYTSPVRPILGYANVTWPVSLKKNIDKLKGVHRRATHLLPELRHSEYHDRLRLLNLPSLLYRRFRRDMIEAYKFCHHILTTVSGILTMANSSITGGHNRKLCKLSCRSRIRQTWIFQSENCQLLEQSTK